MNKKVRIISLKILVILLHIQCAGGMKNSSKSAFKASKSFFRKFTSITNNFKHRFHRTYSNPIPRFYKSKSYRNTTINKLNLLTPISLSALCIDLKLNKRISTDTMIIKKYVLINPEDCDFDKNYVGIVSYHLDTEDIIYPLSDISTFLFHLACKVKIIENNNNPTLTGYIFFMNTDDTWRRNHPDLLKKVHTRYSSYLSYNQIIFYSELVSGFSYYENVLKFSSTSINNKYNSTGYYNSYRDMEFPEQLITAKAIENYKEHGQTEFNIQEDELLTLKKWI